MKLRASPKRNGLVVELDRAGETLPAIPAGDFALRRILVPIDFSECSTKAMAYASSFARQFGAELMLLHVIEPVFYADGANLAILAAVNTSVRDEAMKRVEECKQSVGENVVVTSAVREGRAFEQILRAAEETNTDLIIIGTHGRGALARFFIGSTAERVVRHAPCPVLVVREREHDFVEATAERESRRNSPQANAE